MACNLLAVLGAEGEGFAQAAPDERETDLVSDSSKSKNKPANKDVKKQRAKKGEVEMLSTSFSCWRKVPDARPSPDACAVNFQLCCLCYVVLAQTFHYLLRRITSKIS